MAAPSYTEDLTDIDLAQATTNWAEPTATGWTDGGTPTADGDYPYIQDTLAISQTITKASICALMANNGSGITIPTDGAVFVWQCFSSNRALDTYANGGLRVIIGNSLSAFYGWAVGGSNKGFYPYGGWQNHAVNPGVTPDYTAGAPSGTWQYIGAAAKSLAAIGKGNPHAVDAVRYGRGSSIFESGDAGNGYCTFAGYTATDETNTNRWGLARLVPGGYLWKGKMTLGTSGTAVDFRDSNASVIWDETPKVTANFNLIEVNNASSRVDWTNVVHRCTSTVSKTRLLVNADADLNWDLCQFYNMGTMTFGGTTGYCTNAKFQGCGQISPKGSNLSNSEFAGYEGTSDTGYVNWDVSTDPNGKLDNSTFTKGTASTHAIEFDATNSPTTMTLVNLTYTGYNASNGQTDSALYFKRTTGTVTVNYTGSAPSYKTAGATISLVSSINVTLTGLVNGTEVRVYKTSDGSVVDGTESVTGNEFAFSGASGLGVYIRIFHVDYQPADIIGYTIPASDTEVPVQQVRDRWYSNL
jgi:hypothetical protein